MSVIISTDSACDLFPDLYKQYQIDVVSLYITIEEHSYRDVFEIGPDELFVKYEKNTAKFYFTKKKVDAPEWEEETTESDSTKSEDK